MSDLIHGLNALGHGFGDGFACGLGAVRWIRGNFGRRLSALTRGKPRAKVAILSLQPFNLLLERYEEIDNAIRPLGGFVWGRSA